MELAFLRPIFARPGPWTSVYLDVSRNTEGAVDEVELRWRATRAELAHGGADGLTLDAVEAALPLGPGPVPGVVPGAGRGLAVFAADGEVALAVPLPQPPPRDLGLVGPLPHLLPALVQLGEPVPWLRVVVDRTGADLVMSRGWRPPRTEQVQGGHEYPLHKAAPGGWSQPRYQRAAETTWERNATEVASAVADAAASVDAQVLVLAGDVRARQLLMEHLPVRWRPLVVQAESGSRAPGAAVEPLEEATASAAGEVARRRVASVLDGWQAGRGSGRSRAGLAPVVAAARWGQLETLLLDPAGVDELVWVGPEPTDIAVEPGELNGGRAGPVQAERADAALIRAAAGTGADLMLVDGDPARLGGGVGAVLRYGA